MSLHPNQQGFVSLVERLLEVGRKPSNVIPLPPREPLFTDRQIAEMALKQLEQTNAIVADIGLVTTSRANRLFVQRMREQLERQGGGQ